MPYQRLSVATVLSVFAVPARIVVKRTGRADAPGFSGALMQSDAKSRS